MTAPAGYKQTGIGIIPEDWEVKKLGEIGEVEMCKRIFKEQTAESGDVPFYKIGTFGGEPDAFISRELYNEFRGKYNFPKNGSVLFSAAGTIGRTVIYNGKPAYFQDSNIVWIDNDEKIVLNNFLYNYFNVIKWSTAYGGTVTRLYNEYIKNTLIPLPPLPEQHAIAKALSDMDSYIVSLEKLIAKKKAIKQGAMQELLTGKRRLPGFTRVWINITLSKVLSVNHGQSHRSVEMPFGKYPILGTSGEIARSNNYLYDKPSVLIGRKGTIDKPQYIEVPFWTIDTLFYTSIKPSFCPKFIFYLCSRIDWKNYNEASGVPSLSAKTIEFMEVYLPLNIDEQAAIAAVLSDMDSEIDALTAKLNKAKLIKQGMMQELLTGRIRLIKPETKSISEIKILEFPKREKTAGGHNQAIEDAVILAVVTDLYATKQYPLTPFYAQKLPYLLHRYMEGITEGYTKKAAGPYNPTYRHKTALPIALKNNYVIGIKATYKGNNYLNLIVGNNIDEAKSYFVKWHGNEPLQWLGQFRYIKNRRDELELLTTVDMAMVELRNGSKPIAMSTVKEIIQNSGEWKAKLKREIFSDENISRAIVWSIKLFGEGE
jgi:type I restriction enzyme S subunit